jgi:predicted phage baseplate assembly protein
MVSGAPVLTEIATVRAPDTIPAGAQTPAWGSGTAAADPAGRTSIRLSLVADLAGCYDRAAVRIAGNTAPATHGATQVEVLGSGDAGTPFQRFVLRKSPLTYVDVVSTLQVRVDGVRWTEVRSLLGAGPHDRVFVTRSKADGAVTVQFGDGVMGARPTTGIENITATYRVGTGSAGRLPAARLTLAMTRPLGLRTVSNPMPTGLAADPDPTEMLRRNASRVARAVDRVVALTDFEDFACGTPGFAKARATLAWEDEHHVALLTVAGDAGQRVDEPARAALQAALLAAGIPRQRVAVHVAEIETFDVVLRVRPDPALPAVAVQQGVRAALLAGFGFDARDLGQPVAGSELVAAAQAVPGVVAVTLARLARTTPEGSQAGPGAAPSPLPPGLTTGTPTSLLLVNPAGLTVELT